MLAEHKPAKTAHSQQPLTPRAGRQRDAKPRSVKSVLLYFAVALVLVQVRGEI